MSKKDELVLFRLTPEQKRSLKQFSKKNNIGMSDTIRFSLKNIKAI